MHTFHSHHPNQACSVANPHCAKNNLNLCISRLGQLQGYTGPDILYMCKEKPNILFSVYCIQCIVYMYSSNLHRLRYYAEIQVIFGTLRTIFDGSKCFEVLKNAALLVLLRLVRFRICQKKVRIRIFAVLLKKCISHSKL